MVEAIEAGRTTGWKGNFMEDISKVFQEGIHIPTIILQKHAIFLWTLIGKHDNGWVWEEILGVVKLCGLHPIWKG